MHGVTSVSANGDHSAVLTGRLSNLCCLRLRSLFSQNRMYIPYVIHGSASLYCATLWRLLLCFFLLGSLVVGASFIKGFRLALYLPEHIQ